MTLRSIATTLRTIAAMLALAACAPVWVLARGTVSTPADAALLALTVPFLLGAAGALLLGAARVTRPLPEDRAILHRSADAVRPAHVGA